MACMRGPPPGWPIWRKPSPPRSPSYPAKSAPMLRSPVALMGLGLSKGARVMAHCQGQRCRSGARRHRRAGGKRHGRSGRCARRKLLRQLPAQPAEPGVVTGVRAAPGLGLGVAVRLVQPEIAVEEMGQGAAHETQCLNGAIAIGAGEARRGGGNRRSAIGDPGRASRLSRRSGIGGPCRARKSRDGKSAGYAWRDAIRTQIAVLRGVKDAALCRTRVRSGRSGAPGAGRLGRDAGRSRPRSAGGRHSAGGRYSAVAIDRAGHRAAGGHRHGGRRADLACRDPGRRR